MYLMLLVKGGGIIPPRDKFYLSSPDADTPAAHSVTVTDTLLIVNPVPPKLNV